MTDIYVRTRGKEIDYNVGFLLAQQPPKMPDSKYPGDIEYPTCVLERTEDNGVYLFLSGIPSQRKDYVKTPIYYDLVLAVNPDQDEPWDGNWEKPNNSFIKDERLTWLIWMWLEDVKNALREEIREEGRKRLYFVNLPIAEKSGLGKLLDNTFPKDDIEKLLRLTKDRNLIEDEKNNLNKKLEDFISKIPKPETMPDLSTLVEHNLKTWWGGVRNDDSCKQWIQLVAKLLNGEVEKGKALLLNEGTNSSVKSLFTNNEYFGVLLDKKWSLSEPTLIESRPENISKKDKYTKQIIRGLNKGKLIETLIEIAGKETDSINNGIQNHINNYSKKKSQ